ncbi:MAG: hypothetical protein ACUVXA_12090 [Candidatus Jordarchaeum sp.]|uniref:hypothetical protein n=1 Tax=Candidatus Jordarchaeum sp. TaxID=2823881 RepID=UPI00404B5367
MIVITKKLRTFLYDKINYCFRDYQQAMSEVHWFIKSSREEAERFINAKLYRYLRYCQKYCPYWKKRWPKQARNFTVNEAKDILALLPPIRKEELHKYNDDLRIRQQQHGRKSGFPYIFKQHQIFSGGSTGIPTSVWQDSRFDLINRAMVDWSYYQMGFKPGLPTIYLWGSNNELFDIKKSFTKRISNRLRGLIIMPAFSMSAEIMRSYINLINTRHDVENAICFVSAIDTLTNFIKRKGISIRRLKRVITGGGTLYPELRERIKHTLADEVYDTYGSRDVGLMAVETPKHMGLVALQWHNHLEVLDDDFNQCEPGENGQVYVTTLNNHSMGLIRMQMGDVATLGNPEILNWKGPVLAKLIGRTAEHLIAPDGSKIDPSAVIHLIGVLTERKWLKKFQLVQQGPTQFLLKIETWHNISKETATEFRQQVATGLTRLFHSSIQLDLDLVDHIPPSRSGKHMYCYVEWKPKNHF